jgi:hypothetical protein
MRVIAGGGETPPLRSDSHETAPKVVIYSPVAQIFQQF